MDGRFAIELRRERLLHQILALDDARQRSLEHLVAALVGRYVGETKLVVQLLLGRRHPARHERSLGRPRPGPPASCRIRRAALRPAKRMRSQRCATAARHCRYVQQSSSPELQPGDDQTRDDREMVTKVQWTTRPGLRSQYLAQRPRRAFEPATTSSRPLAPRICRHGHQHTYVSTIFLKPS